MAKYEQIPNVKPSLFTRARGELNTDPGIRATKETDIFFLILNAFKKRSLFVCHFLFIAQFEFQIRLRMTMMREIRGVMAGRLALMTLIVAQQEPLMKVLPWKSKIPDCSSYISPPAVLKPIHLSPPAQPQNKQGTRQIWNIDNNNFLPSNNSCKWSFLF